MRKTSHPTADEIPSFRVAQVELARFKRTGSPVYLAHAQRALEDAQNEIVALSRRRWRDDLTARLGGDVPGFNKQT